jgi:dimethylhistidine N-methyltransferase
MLNVHSHVRDSRPPLAALAPLPVDDAADRAELAAALAETPPRIPSKYFYDAAGSELFERICELPEYYPTRTELGIMDRHVAAMAARLGPDAVVVEYGSGTSVKTRWLLRALDRPRAYVPVDVSIEPLMAAAASLAAEFPDLVVEPVCADFTRPFALPGDLPAGRRVAFFPGSTIGNFRHDEARELLARMRETVGPGGAALVGADLRKDPDVLRAAYDDAQGVTAEFNLNLLRHVNRRFALGLDPEAFRHYAPWCDREGRIEMRLVATRPQRAVLDGRAIEFAAGDYVLTEYSHKYRLDEFTALASDAGWRTRRVWTDARDWFAVLLLET